jgi:hypothetical protein
VLLRDHTGLRVHLGLADRALLLFDRDLSVELAFADGAFLLDRKIAPGEDRLVRVLQDRLARLRFQRFRRIRRRLDAADRDTEDLQPERFDVGAAAQARCNRLGDAVGGAQRLLQRQLLDRLLR